MKSYQARGNPGHGGLDQIFHTTAHFKLLSGGDQGTGGSDHPAIAADLALNANSDSQSPTLVPTPATTESKLPTPVPTYATTAASGSCCGKCGDEGYCSSQSGICYA